MAPHTSKPIAKAVPLQIGDTALIKTLMTTTFWKRAWSDYQKAFLSLVPQYFSLMGSISSFCMTALLRYKFDSFNCGLGTCLICTSFILTFNGDLWWVFKPFTIFLLPIIALFFLDMEIWINFAFVSCHSIGLSIYAIIFFLCALFHTMRVYFYKDKKLPKNGRGVSWLYLLIEKLVKRISEKKKRPEPILKIGEFWVHIIVEPALFIGLGVLMYYIEDYYFAAFLWIISSAELVNQIKLKVYEIDTESYESL